MDDFSLALERIVAGLEKKNRLLNEHERKVTAYHEIGHALVARALPGTDPVHKVSIIPRGIGALGYTIQRPTEDRFLMSSGELKDKMAVLLGGRAAESIVFRETSTGAADDLAKATNIARSMVTRYGMDDNLGMVSLESERATSPSRPLGRWTVLCATSSPRPSSAPSASWKPTTMRSPRPPSGCSRKRRSAATSCRC
jgi:cell division protease FtsH